MLTATLLSHSTLVLVALAQTLTMLRSWHMAIVGAGLVGWPPIILSIGRRPCEEPPEHTSHHSALPTRSASGVQMRYTAAVTNTIWQ